MVKMTTGENLLGQTVSLTWDDCVVTAQGVENWGLTELNQELLMEHFMEWQSYAKAGLEGFQMQYLD